MTAGSEIPKLNAMETGEENLHVVLSGFFVCAGERKLHAPRAASSGEEHSPARLHRGEGISLLAGP